LDFFLNKMAEYSLKSIQKKGNRLIRHHYCDGENTSLVREFCRDGNGKVLTNLNHIKDYPLIIRSLIVANEEIFRGNIRISKIETKIVEDE